VSLADVGMASIVFADPLAVVEQLPVEAVGADRILESPVIAFPHGGEKTASGFAIGPTAAGLGAARREHEGCQY
jgi:hypothetical protein